LVFLSKTTLLGAEKVLLTTKDSILLMVLDIVEEGKVTKETNGIDHLPILLFLQAEC
jgi:hypothetical protein